MLLLCGAIYFLRTLKILHINWTQEGLQGASLSVLCSCLSHLTSEILPTAVIYRHHCRDRFLFYFQPDLLCYYVTLFIYNPPAFEWCVCIFCIGNWNLFLKKSQYLPLEGGAAAYLQRFPVSDSRCCVCTEVEQRRIV